MAAAAGWTSSRLVRSRSAYDSAAGSALAPDDPGSATRGRSIPGVSSGVPAFFGAGGELLAVDNAAYYKLTGPLAQFSAPDGKYTKVAIPDLSGIASGLAPSPSLAASPSLSPEELIAKLNEALGKLPTPPVKGAD